ncbi:unnamed protein product [Allacma fusca]|uniref:HMG box domain-containing protein n=1 Tax=Allacma fusca TaxID=39272 RepID=A0A8J2PKM4_9HEXA|nr:unnamed protein product [Allacma fusca]
MNINGPPIMDMSMNPNGYHQPYLPPTMMPPPPPQHSAPPHHSEGGGGMAVGPPQQQPPPAHPPQQQAQSQSAPGTSGVSGQGTNSNQGSTSGGESTSGMTGHGAGSGTEGPNTPQKNSQKKSWPKKKVYKKPDPNAPKQRRFSGYYVYMRERRDQLRSMYPEMPFYEIIRQLAQEWNNMDRDIKQKYLDSAEADKQNYEREMSAYKKTESYKAMNKRKSKKNMGNHSGGSGMNMMNRTGHLNHDSGLEIPIFTEEFLDHNKARELELRALRKTVAECEEQNATLQKHVEQMQAEIERMEHEMRQQKLQNEMLSQNLNRLRSVLASSFASLPLPGTHEPPNIHTIDKYMNEVKAMQEANSVHFAPFLNRVKDIISRLEL